MSHLLIFACGLCAGFAIWSWHDRSYGFLALFLAYGAAIAVMAGIEAGRGL